MYNHILFVKVIGNLLNLSTASKRLVFGVFLTRIFPDSDTFRAVQLAKIWLNRAFLFPQQTVYCYALRF